MANTNYSKMSKANKPVEPKAEETKVTEQVVEEVKAPVEPKVVIGKVANCKKLNVRKQPSKEADVVKVIDAGTKVTINESFTNDKWYSVSIGKLKGYCMKDYIKINA